MGLEFGDVFICPDVRFCYLDTLEYLIRYTRSCWADNYKKPALCKVSHPARIYRI